MMLTLSLLAAPLLAVAQPAGQMRRIGMLRGGATSGVTSRDFERNFAAFRQGLRDLGWVEGQNLTIELRATEDHTERLPALAAELVGLPVEVIVTMGGPTATRAAQDGVPTVLEQKTTICCKYLSLHGLAIVAVPKKALRHPVYGTSTPLTRLIDIAHPFFRVQKLAHSRICHSLK
jgi:hypothetical protein